MIKKFNNRILLINILFAIMLAGCLYEAPPTTYCFKIINNTSCEISVESKMESDEYIVIEKIIPHETYKREIVKYHCYQDYYKDTLIPSFFQLLEISCNEKKLVIDPNNRKNWKEEKELRGIVCEEGFIRYSLEIIEDHVK